MQRLSSKRVDSSPAADAIGRTASKIGVGVEALQQIPIVELRIRDRRVALGRFCR